MEGGEVCYHWRDTEESFDGQWLLLDGIMGRSRRNVYAIVLPEHLEKSIKQQMVSDFPNVKIIGLMRFDVSEADPRELQSFCKHYAEEADLKRESQPVIIRIPMRMYRGWTPLECLKTHL